MKIVMSVSHVEMSININLGRSLEYSVFVNCSFPRPHRHVILM